MTENKLKSTDVWAQSGEAEPSEQATPGPQLPSSEQATPTPQSSSTEQKALSSQPPSSEETTPTSRPALWTRDFILITGCNLLIFLSFHSVPAVLPVYLSGLGVGPDLIGLAVSLTTLTVVISRPFVGAGIDHIGRRVFLLLGLAGLGLTLGPLGMVPAIGFVLAMRFLHGVAWGSANTASTTIAADVIPHSRFGEGMGYFSLSSAVALAIAPAVALTLLNYIEFWLVALLACILIGAAALAALFIHYKPVQQKGQPSTALARDTEQAGEKPVESVQATSKKSAIPAHAASIKPVESVQAASKKSAKPSSPKMSLAAMFEVKAVLPGVMVLFVNMVYGAVNTFMALTGYDRGISDIAMFFVFYAVAVMFSRPFFGKLVDRRGYALPIVLGLLCDSTAMALVNMSTSLELFLVAAVVFGVGQGCVLSALQTMAIANVPFERRGAATSTFFIFFDLGIGLGAIASGLVANQLGFSSLYIVFAVLPLVALGIYLIFGRRRGRAT
ncbi:MAG: MFS transporter [Coriobacteriales bacterium]|jgi:MFS family permease|nr:MFS transporter [Coriobacteriales bacterium]